MNWKTYYIEHKDKLSKIKQTSFEQWFWSNIKIHNNKDLCWEWVSSPRQNGYGRVNIFKRSFYAHRVAYELHNNRVIKDSYLICHSCDNTLCCNPNHLFEGTQGDNMRDCNKKRRNVYGSSCHTASLTEQDIVRIFELYVDNKQSAKDIARLYTTTYATINRVLNRRIWKQVEIPARLLAAITSMRLEVLRKREEEKQEAVKAGITLHAYKERKRRALYTMP